MKTSTTDTDETDHHDHHDFKGKTARGAFASIFGQGANFALRIISMMVLARLLSPRDFGLVAMATAITGFLTLFQDFGLSTAAVQSPSITRDQTSMLFWINLSIGSFLALLCILAAPFLAAFYHEPRVEALTMVIASGFLFSGAAAQHRAMLSRKMRIALLAATDLTGTALSVALGITMAALGCGYWSLAAMAVCPPFVGCVAVWFFGKWLPNLPRRGTGVMHMLRYGSLVMADNVVMYIGYNMDKVLLGRFAGATPLGFYNRAYQLINIPTTNLCTAVGNAAFPALSRLQGEPARLRNYFLKCYTLFLSLNIPITIACGLFGEDIIRVFLGAKWMDSVPLFRLLAPTMLAVAIINPPGLLLAAIGRVKESLWIGLAIAPTVILGFVIGLPYGPTGIASGFSASMLLLAVPVTLWAIHYTPVSPADIWQVIRPPLYSVLVAAGAALLVSIPAAHLHFVLLRLSLICGVLFTVYFIMLFFPMGQKELYLKVLHGLGFKRAAPPMPKISEMYVPENPL